MVDETIAVQLAKIGKDVEFMTVRVNELVDRNKLLESRMNAIGNKQTEMELTMLQKQNEIEALIINATTDDEPEGWSPRIAAILATVVATVVAVLANQLSGGE